MDDLKARLLQAASDADGIVETVVKLAERFGVDVEKITGPILGQPTFAGSPTIREAADRIEKLEAENAQFEAKLKELGPAYSARHPRLS